MRLQCHEVQTASTVLIRISGVGIYTSLNSAATPPSPDCVAKARAGDPQFCQEALASSRKNRCHTEPGRRASNNMGKISSGAHTSLLIILDTSSLVAAMLLWHSAPFNRSARWRQTDEGLADAPFNPSGRKVANLLSCVPNSPMSQSGQVEGHWTKPGLHGGINDGPTMAREWVSSRTHTRGVLNTTPAVKEPPAVSSFRPFRPLPT
jgi:hypothetical protein